MGSTTSFGHPWPAGTELVSTGDDAIRSLAEDVEATEKDILAVRRTLLAGRGVIGSDIIAATYVLYSSSIGSAPASVATVSSSTGLVSTYIDDADYAISGMTAKMRIRGIVSTNATQPTITFTFGLYPITFQGAADTLTATLGTVVSGSTAASPRPRPLHRPLEPAPSSTCQRMACTPSV